MSFPAIMKTNIMIISILALTYNVDACPNDCNCYLNQKTNLKTVDCSRLLDIPVNIDADTQDLNIRDSNIPNITSVNFHNLKSLISLHLVSCNIQLIEPGSFKTLWRLEDLSLRDNHILSLGTSGLFKGLHNLRILHLQKNLDVDSHFSELPDSIWSDVPNLEQLFMDGIINKIFPSGFSNLRKLSVLSLNGRDGSCSFHNMPSDIFEAFVAAPISYLDISYCHIQYLQPLIFIPFHNISTIKMNNQRISYNEDLSNLLSSFENSTISSLFMNNLIYTGSFKFSKELFRSLRYTALKELYFENNFFSWVDDDFWSSLPKTLTALSVEGNYMFGGSLVGIFGLPYLKNFSVTILSSKIPPQSAPFFIKYNLQHLRLYIVEFADPLPGLSFSGNDLRSLSWNGGTLAELSGHLVGLNKLEHFQVTNTKLRNLTNGYFKSMGALQSINISWNNLDLLISGDINGQIFERSRNVIMLDISGNGLRSLPRKLFAHIIKLKRLFVHTNALAQFDVDIRHLKDLEVLDLSHNDISSLASSVTDHLDTVLSDKTVINLQNNPLKCSCDTYRFIVWVQNRWKYLHAPNTYSCFLDNGTNVPFTRLDDVIADLDATCASHMMLIIITSMAISLLTSITLGKIICKYRLHMIYLYYAGRRMRRLNPLENDKEYPFDAFISFADEDFNFVKKCIMRNCEQVYGLKLCIHCRDFMPGTSITDNISNAIHFSRKTVIVLSPDFLKSEWCRFEFNMARIEQLYSGRDVLLLVVCASVTNGDLTLDMLEAKFKTYLTIPEDENLLALFVQRLTRSIRGEII